MRCPLAGERQGSIHGLFSASVGDSVHGWKVVVGSKTRWGARTVKTQPRSTTSSLRVTKKLLPESRGALKLARQFGEALICVRHRSDDKGEYRYTTVELLVEKTPIRPRTDNLVGVRIGPDEKPLQTVVRAAGGTWDYKAARSGGFHAGSLAS
jgi:hypothetical protein